MRLNAADFALLPVSGVVALLHVHATTFPDRPEI
jgi:hypothetical protein